jgi:hypothetical protein
MEAAGDEASPSRLRRVEHGAVVTPRAAWVGGALGVPELGRKGVIP